MNIDERDIEKGALSEILPKFYPDSISYLSELNAYRMYAEIWSNKRSKEGEKRSEIGHSGYLKTLEFGESKKRRKIDKVRFDNFVAADSVNYKGAKTVYGEMNLYIQMGGVQANSVFNRIIRAKPRSRTQSILPNSDSHSGDYLPEALELDLMKLGLSHDEKTNKHHFEIPTKVNSISNENQKKILLQVLGRDDLFEKLHLLHQVGRKYIVCLFENPEDIRERIGRLNLIPRLCVAWPFQETLVFDFAGTPEEYGDSCLLGTLINGAENITKAPIVKPKVQQEDTGWIDGPQLDSFA